MPKTPILHAEETCDALNQTAAKRAGTERTNTCDKATTLWPKKPTQKRSGDTEPTFIQEPMQVPVTPIIIAKRRP